MSLNCRESIIAPKKTVSKLTYMDKLEIQKQIQKAKEIEKIKAKPAESRTFSDKCNLAADKFEKVASAFPDSITVIH